MNANPRLTQAPPLTPKRIAALKPRAQRYEIGDSAAPGLRLRVLPTGAKTFHWYVRVDAKLENITLGHWSDEPAPGHLTVDEARTWLQRLKKAHRGGQLQAMKAELHAQLHPVPAPAEPGSELLSSIAEDFYKRRIEPHRKRPLEARHVLDTDILPVIGRRGIATITTPECAKVVERVVDRGAPTHAGKVLGLLKQLFRFAEARGYIDRNPAGPLEPASLGVEHNVRQRWLSAEEIAIFWRALESTTELAPGRHEKNTMRAATKAALQLLLLTGVRSCELLLARWEDVDFEAARWTVPVANQKLTKKQARQAKPWVVPLLPLAVERFKLLHDLAGDSQWVMASDDAAPDVDQHYTEKALGRAMRRLWRAHPELSKLDEASPHDLRRTLRTQLGQLRVPLHIVERCLNHSLGRIVQIYDHGDYIEERREAMQRWEGFIGGLVSTDGAKVVPLPEAAPRARQAR